MSAALAPAVRSRPVSCESRDARPLTRRDEHRLRRIRLGPTCGERQGVEVACMPKIDVASLPEFSGSSYPAPYDEPCRDRTWKRLGDAAGLTQFGVHLMRLAPG